MKPKATKTIPLRKLSSAGSSFSLSSNHTSTKKGDKDKNHIREDSEPKSKKIAAALKPLVILVSIRVKKTGPIAKAKYKSIKSRI